MWINNIIDFVSVMFLCSGWLGLSRTRKSFRRSLSAPSEVKWTQWKSAIFGRDDNKTLAMIQCLIKWCLKPVMFYIVGDRNWLALDILYYLWTKRRGYVCVISVLKSWNNKDAYLRAGVRTMRQLHALPSGSIKIKLISIFLGEKHWFVFNKIKQNKMYQAVLFRN